MIRFLVNLAVYMGSAAIALVIADVVLGDNFQVSYPLGLVIATVIFGVIQAILSPFFESVTERNAQMLTGAAGLFSAFVALIATETITDSLNVQGATTWFLAALIIWLGSMFAGFLLKVTVAKRFIQEVRD
jgi:uncharacterized membrane protein YvlD (DUF360 family)